MQCQLIHDDLNIIIYIKRKSNTNTHMCNQILLWNILKTSIYLKVKSSIKKSELICIISPKWCKKFNKEIKGIDNNDGFEKI